MKIKIDAKELINEQRKTQKRCVELIGNGKYAIVELEKIVEELRKFNEALTKSCSKSTTIKVTSCGGSLNNWETPAITQGKLYRENQYLIFALTKQIVIAKTNNLEFVTDFNFTNEQILNYGHKNGIVL